MPKGSIAIGAEGDISRPSTRRTPAVNSKRQEVLDVACEYFLRHGYEGASISAMARSAGISKESVYRYFSGKKELFEAVIDRELLDYQEQLRDLDATLKGAGLHEALVAISETILGLITTDRTLALRRLIFEEATRSPDVGQHYYQIGPETAYVKLEALFSTHLGPEGCDTKLLGRHFVAILSHRVMLERECRVQPEPTRDEVRATAETIVTDFLKVFAQRT
jgi:AcrR family transcriptional regulator